MERSAAEGPIVTYPSDGAGRFRMALYGHAMATTMGVVLIVPSGRRAEINSSCHEARLQRAIAGQLASRGSACVVYDSEPRRLLDAAPTPQDIARHARRLRIALREIGSTGARVTSILAFSLGVDAVLQLARLGAFPGCKEFVLVGAVVPAATPSPMRLGQVTLVYGSEDFLAAKAGARGQVRALPPSIYGRFSLECIKCSAEEVELLIIDGCDHLLCGRYAKQFGVVVTLLADRLQRSSLSTMQTSEEPTCR
jgi:hypothetical protein